MHKYLYLLLSLLFISCAIQSNKPVNYNGLSQASEPYVELTSMTKWVGECDNFTKTCSVTVIVEPILHNPTNSNIEGTLICTYKVGEWEAPDLVSDIIKLAPKKSMKVSYRNMLTVPGNQRSKLTVGCYFRYTLEGSDAVFYTPTFKLISY